jgi:hypothetical protein
MNTPFNEFSEEIDSNMIVQMYQHLLQNRIVAKYLIKTLYQLEQGQQQTILIWMRVQMQLRQH